MTDKYVREVGRVEDMDGRVLVIGLDYDCVTIGPHCFTAAQMEEVAQYQVSAVWQAGQQKAAMDAMVSLCSGDCGCRLGTDDTCSKECCETVEPGHDGYPDSERDADAIAYQSGEDPRDGAG